MQCKMTDQQQHLSVEIVHFSRRHSPRFVYLCPLLPEIDRSCGRETGNFSWLEGCSIKIDHLCSRRLSTQHRCCTGINDLSTTQLQKRLILHKVMFMIDSAYLHQKKNILKFHVKLKNKMSQNIMLVISSRTLKLLSCKIDKNRDRSFKQAALDMKASIEGGSEISW